MEHPDDEISHQQQHDEDGGAQSSDDIDAAPTTSIYNDYDELPTGAQPPDLSRAPVTLQLRGLDQAQSSSTDAHGDTDIDDFWSQHKIDLGLVNLCEFMLICDSIRVDLH